MSLSKFVSSLLPMSKSRLVDDIAKLREELREYNRDNYEAAKEHFKEFKLQSKICRKFNDDYGRRLNTRDNYVKATYEITLNAIEVLDVLDDLVDEHTSANFTGTGTSFIRANIVRHIELVGFFAKYSRALLLYTYAEETAALNIKGHDATAGDFLTKPEREWLYAQYGEFLNASRVLRHKPKWVKSAYANIPDIVVNEESESTLKETLGDAKLNPMYVNFVNSRWWPIYHIRIAITEWQVLRRDKAVEERKATQFRLLHLKTSLSGDNNAKVEQEIAYLEDRISKLSRKIDKLEG